MEPRPSSAAVVKSDQDKQRDKKLTAQVEFTQAESSLEVQKVESPNPPEDTLLGNPDHRPFAIILPVRRAIPGTTLADPEIKHQVFFVRMKSGTDVGFLAMELWNRHVRVPEFPGAEYPSIEGELVSVTLDDQDFLGYWKEAIRKFKQDEGRWPVHAFGHWRCPYAFCSPNIDYDLLSMGSNNLTGIQDVSRQRRV